MATTTIEQSLRVALDRRAAVIANLLHVRPAPAAQLRSAVTQRCRQKRAIRELLRRWSGCNAFACICASR